MHPLIVAMCVYIVFGPELFKANKKEIMERYGFTATDIHPLLSILTPRRCGKTWGIAMIMVALMVSVPNIRIAIFSKVLGQVKAMIFEAKKFMADFFPHVKLNMDQTLGISYKVSEQDERFIRGYSSQEDVSLND
jgi:hypothetical protein